MVKRVRWGSSNAAIGYVRRSTGKQDNAHEVQARAIAAWCEKRGLELLAIFIDDCSRTTAIDKRAGLVAAFASLRALDVGVIVVQKRDRMADGAVIADAFETAAKSNGARVHDTEGASEREGVSGVIDRGMRDLVSAIEIAQIRARTKAALAVKKARGEMTGKAPYGFRVGVDGRTLERDEAEQAVLALVRDLAARGARTCTILKRVNDAGYLSRVGKPFMRTQIVNMLRVETVSRVA
jgi:DNA invertase Pin-like site-specific DNA recombinase